MKDPADLLQIKIEEAKAKLPEATRRAIERVDWRASILAMRAKRGYSFEQLENLEIETELLLCGLIRPENYPKELENRMRLSKEQVSMLVNEMNNQVFSRIREELIKDVERSKNQSVKINSVKDKEKLNSDVIKTNETQILNSAGIEIVSPPPAMADLGIKNVSLETKKETSSTQEVHPLLAQKLSESFQIPAVKTEYSLGDVSKPGESILRPTAGVLGSVKPVSSSETKVSPSYHLSGDPYREILE